MCRWLELGERLQLDYLKASALHHIEWELSQGRTLLLGDRCCLRQVFIDTATEIMAMVPANTVAVAASSRYTCSNGYCRMQFGVIVSSHYACRVCPGCGQYQLSQVQLSLT